MLKYNLIITAFMLTGLLVLASGCPQSGKEPASSGSGVAPATPAGGSGTPSIPVPVVAANPATDFSFAKFSGEAGKMSDYFGKPLVVNFWATW